MLNTRFHWIQLFKLLLGDKNRINSSGPQNNLQRSNSMMGNNNDLSQFPPHQHPINQQQSNESNMQFPSDTPHMPFGPNAQQQQQNKMGNFMDQKPGDVIKLNKNLLIYLTNS